MMIKNSLLPKTRNENIVVQEMENEILIYDLKTNKAYCLNETSAMIYQLCDGKNSIAEISQKLSEQSNQPMTEDLIWLALNDFKKDNLLEQSEKFEIDFNGLSRRQVIKKIGFASLVTLPVIASVTAPAAGAAASACFTAFGVCQMGTYCSACPPGTPIMGRLFLNSQNGTCSGNTSTFSSICGGGTNVDYIIDSFA